MGLISQRIGKQTGFTLLEIMVVIVLIAVFTTSVALNLRITTARDSDFERAAKRLFLVMNTASEEAVLFVKNYGIKFTPTGYSFYELVYEEVAADDDDLAADNIVTEINPDEPRKNLPNQPKKQHHFVWRELNPSDKNSPYRQYQLPDTIINNHYFEVSIEGVPISLEVDTFKAHNQTADEQLKPTLIFSADGEILPEFGVRLLDDSGKNFYSFAYNEEGVLQLDLHGDSDE